MSVSTLDVMIATNPADGEELGRVAATPPEQVAEAVARSREARAEWGETAWAERRTLLKRWSGLIARDAESWADLLRDEIGKPRSEAFAGDVIAALESIRWTVKHGGKALRGERIGPGHQRLLQVPAGRLRHRPVGVVGILGTWNYPLFLNAPAIAQAVGAGNGVVWKPSELAVLSGKKLQESLDEAGFPDGLVSAVFGGAAVGQALVASGIDKGMFTGGVENGRRVIGALGALGVPALAELSGFDAAIVLPDAPLASTADALCWGAFLNAGQACVAVKRLYVIGDPAPWAEALASRARALRVGDPRAGVVDLGPMIHPGARLKFHAMIRATVNAGAEILAGGEPLPGPGAFYPPTVLIARDNAPESALAGCFGPVILIRGVPDVEAALEATNASAFGLGASVWSRDTRAASAVANRIVAGMVTVNDAVTPAMHASAPFGGFKASGFGRTHGVLGLREFTQPQVVYARRAGGFRPHLFPYGKLPIESVLRLYRRLFHA